MSGHADEQVGRTTGSEPATRHGEPATGTAMHRPATHTPSRRTATAGKCLAALGPIVVFMVAEVCVGIASGSPALISDAGHMLTDGAAQQHAHR